MNTDQWSLMIQTLTIIAVRAVATFASTNLISVLLNVLVAFLQAVFCWLFRLLFTFVISQGKPAYDLLTPAIRVM